MNRQTKSFLRAARSAILVAGLFATSTGGHATDIGAGAGVADFETHFEPFETVLPDYDLEPGAVDITEIDPPIEIEADPVARTLGSGVASYYGKRFAGRKTANGERFNPRQMTAAHKTLPFGTKVRVTNPSNGRSVIVRINDRGPYARGRLIDLSRAAAEEIGMIQRGHAKVELALLDS